MNQKQLYFLLLAFCLPLSPAFAQGNWTQKNDLPAQNREGAAGFSIGTKGYLGTGLGFYNDFWEWDQTTGTWTQKANFPGAPRAEDVGFSVGSKGYIGMGWGGNDPSIMFKDFYEYNPATNTWTQIPDFPGPGDMGRAGSVGIGIGNFGYVGMGEDTNQANFNDWWQYDPATAGWSQKQNFAGSARNFPAAFSLNAKGYVGTGINGFSHYKDFWEYDPSGNSWTQKANFPGAARMQAHSFAMCGKGYIGLGAILNFLPPNPPGFNCFNDFYEWDPTGNTWTQMANFPGGARREGPSWNILGIAYTMTGGDNGSFNSFPAPPGFKDLWEFLPPSFPQVTISSSPNAICAGQSVNFSATTTGSVSNWNWSFSGGNPSSSVHQNPTGIAYNTAGTYIVTLTATVAGACGGTFTKTDTVIVQQPPTTAVIAGSTNICSGASAVLSATGGDTYQWSTGQNTPTITVSPSSTTTYTVTATNACGTDTAQITVNVGGGSLTMNTTSTLASCGQCNGTAAVTVTGGSGNYLYSWSNGATTQSIANVCAGVYSVTVSESGGGGSVFYSENFTNGGAGWSLNSNGTGTNDANANQWVVNNTTPLCTGGSGGNYLHVTCSGSIFTGCDNTDANYSPGNPFYPASTDKFSSSPAIATLGKSNMILKFTYQCNGDAGMDYGLVRLFNGSSWTDLSTQYSGTTTCTQASITIPATYENLTNFKIGFRWLNNNDQDGNDPPFVIDDIELSGSSSGGTCTNSASVTVNASSSVSASINNITDATCGNSNGSATASATGGSTPYAYSWNTGAASPSLSGLAAGTYSVTITDASGCTATTATTVENTGTPNASTTVTNASCNGQTDGAATVNANGGNSPYTYSWSTGATTQTITGLSAGNYNVTITDANSCTTTASATVTGNGIPTATASTGNVSCYGGANGSATVIISNGTPPYSYLWNTGDTTSSVSGLVVGNYTVAITDSAGCYVTAIAIISQPGEISANTFSTNANCSANDGSASVQASGGTSPYYYLWNTLPAQTLQTATGLAAGSYSVTITDDNSCTHTATATVSNSNAPAVSITSVAPVCNGGNNGAATVSAIGGSSPYSYLWNTGDTVLQISNLTSQTYFVTVTDAAGCNGVSNITINDPPAVNATIIPSSVSVCAGGSTSLSASGGNSYTWSTGQSGDTIPVTNITSGTTIFVTATDVNGCTGADSSVISVSNIPVTVNFSGDSAVCMGAQFVVTASGSGANSPYTYLWGTGETNQTISVNNISSDSSFFVTVTDAGNCIGTDSVSVQAISVSVSVTGAGTICIGQSVSLIATGANKYVWSTGDSSNSIIVSPTYDSSFAVVGTNPPGCSDTDSVVVNVRQELDAIVSKDTIVGFGATMQISASGGTSYSWSTGETTSYIRVTLEEDTRFIVTVTDSYGCQDIDTINIKVDCKHSTSNFIPTIFSPNGDGSNEFIKVHGYGFSELELIIYDRWGEKIITITDKNQTWDGTLHGTVLNSAVFVYILKLKFCDGTEYNEKGNITLVR